MSEKNIYTAAVVLPGTAVGMTYNIGFIPTYVKIDAYSSPTVASGKLTAGTYVGTLEWNDTMAPLSGVLTTGGAGGDVKSLVVAKGISPSTSSSSFKGFTVGIDTTVNVATYAWVITAVRG